MNNLTTTFKSTKLAKKIARQNAKMNNQLGSYTNGQKGSVTKRTHAKGNLWNHQNDTTSTYEMKKNISTTLNSLYNS